MREILFKAKRVDDREWVVGQYVNTCYPGKDKETGHFIVVYPNEYHEVYTSTLCQFTGLCDKNGKSTKLVARIENILISLILNIMK